LIATAFKDRLALEVEGVVLLVLVFDLVRELVDKGLARVGGFQLDLQLLLQPSKLLRIILL
jgi:hypothetical protein